MLIEEVKDHAESMALVDPRKDLVSLEQAKSVDAIVEADTRQELEKQLELFNLNQTKKNVLRLARLNGLLDQADEQLLHRLEKRPDQLTTKDILDIMNTVSAQVDRINDFNDRFAEDTKSTIKIAQHNTTEVNINMTPDLTRDEKNDVMDAVASLLKQLKQAKKATPGVVLYPQESPQELSENSDTIDINSEEDN